MSLRALIRTVALTLGLLLATPLLWRAAGPWALLIAPGLALFAAAYLALRMALEEKQSSRWQIRYKMDTRIPQVDERLEAILNFLAGRGAHLIVEMNSQGLFLEASPDYDRYIPAQLTRTLPEAKIAKVKAETLARDITFLLAGTPEPELLSWAVGGQDRQVRLHLRQGGCAALAYANNGTQPPGRWLGLPRRLTAATWQRLPIWDEMAAAIQAKQLFPTTNDAAPFSSRSRLLRLSPAAGLAGGDRLLGHSPDKQLVTLNRAAPLLTIGASAAFLTRQVLQDLETGRTVVVISPHRRILNQIGRQAGVMTYWLDQENSRLSIHLAVVSAAEWAGQPPEIEAVVITVETFLSDLGLDLRTPAMQNLARDLIRILAASARATGNDFTFIDLYAVAQATGALKAFLNDLAGLAARLDTATADAIRRFLNLLEDRSGYAQVTAVLSTIRTALGTIRSGSIQGLCQPPFLNARQGLGGNNLILVPTTNADFPEHNRFLVAMMGATLSRFLPALPVLSDNEGPVLSGNEGPVLSHGDGAATEGRPGAVPGDEPRIALHLHDPQAYCIDDSRRWFDLARQSPRLSLLLDVQDPSTHAVLRRLQDRQNANAGQMIFHCSEKLAAALIDEWHLNFTLAELVEIPAGMALARLPGLPDPITVGVENTATAAERQ